jgi:hypothetical protein
MAQSLSELRKKKSGFEQLQKEVEKISSGKSGSSDDRFWKPETDQAGNGSAIIRFLPAPKGEDLPWISVWHHSFKGPTGKWYWENSLSTIGLDDPVGALNSQLWNTGLESDKEIARKQKRKLNYFANILVISDPKHPENNGQVKLFRFGKKLFDKIKDAMDPEFEDETPINPFDFWEGANFKLKIREVDGWPSYDKSEFAAPSEIADSDEEIEEIWNKQESLTAFHDPSNFKSYEELKRKLDFVLGGAQVKPAAVEADDDEDFTPAPKAEVKKEAKKPVVVDEDLDDESYFQSLADMD